MLSPLPTVRSSEPDAGVISDATDYLRQYANEAGLSADIPDLAPPLSCTDEQAAFPTPCSGTHLHVVTLDTVRPETLTWLWPGRIPFGKLTILEGHPGIGKGHLTMELAACVTTGRPLPDGATTEPAAVLVVSLEDGLGDTIRPRADAAGADCARIHAVTGVTRTDGVLRPPTLPDDLPVLHERMRTSGARLLILDPINAYLSATVDTYKDPDVRRALLPLAQLAEQTGAAVLIVRHLVKRTGVTAITAGAGSIGVIGVARTALLMAEAPEDPTRRVLAVAKSNLAAPADSLECQIEESATGSRLVWYGRSPHSANALHCAQATPRAGTTLEAAVHWLQDFLAAGPIQRAEVLQAGKEAGFAARMIDRAAEQIGVIKRKQEFQGPAIWESPAANLANLAGF